ncbi:MAG: TetR/AcrR family transcriptional regulator [Sphingomicrobium sp.]
MAVSKKSEVTRDRVISVSSDLFRRNGYLATSMRDIAAAAGMKSGSLYYYYESKEMLLAAILNQNMDETLCKLEATVAALPNGVSVRAKFRAAAKANVKIIIDAGDMAIASGRTLSLLPEPEYSEQVKHREAYNDFWRKLLVEGKKSGELKPGMSDALVSMFVIGAMSFVPEWYDPSRSSTEDIAEYYAKLLFDGISATKRAPKAANDAADE